MIASMLFLLFYCIRGFCAISIWIWSFQIDPSVGVYREAVPEGIKEMIEEAASFGEPMSDDEIEYEMKRANHWATIGVGVVGYYQQ